MVALIGNTVNKFIFPPTFNTIIMSHNQQTILLTVNAHINTGMDKSTGTNLGTNNKVRGKPS